jgi:hypothetical protein
MGSLVRMDGQELDAWGDGLDLHVITEGVTGVRDVSVYVAISITEPRGSKLAMIPSINCFVFLV